jgi:hypothetical protein
MHELDLLSAVQPSEGWFCVVGIKNGSPVRQHLVETREELDKIALSLMQREWDVYFGVAKYKTDTNRSKDNVQGLKALWLDIDCGPSKAEVNPKSLRPAGYIDQAAAIAALKAFCNEVGLPKPILVNSGRGVHVYWPLTEEVTREEWEPAAAKLRDLCIDHDLYVDRAVFEAARILRIPGTLNFKDDSPTEVNIIHWGQPHAFSELSSLLGVEPPKPKALFSGTKRELTPLAKSLMGNSIFKFGKIMRRSAKGDGCAQLLDAYENRAELEEPRWRASLSIAGFCVDKEEAIHKLSEGHPDYTPEATQAKLDAIPAPHTCIAIENVNPGGCDGCPHRGKIKTPIVLGKDIAAGSPGENIVIDEAPDGNLESYEIPEYPFPYFRGAEGGIYRRGMAEEEEPVLVYENDLYVVKRMADPGVGDVIVMRLHLPSDGVREFNMPHARVMEVVELKKTLASYGVAAGRKGFDLITDMILAFIKALQHSNKAEKMRMQFGWADNDSKFIIGDQEITPTGIYHSPPSTMTAAIAAHMGPVGSLEKWKEVFALYGRPGLEPHAFAALTAFGAPLLKFLGQKGGIINVIHPSSGTGKTTILHMCMSVYGAPDRTCGIQDDTLNAKIMRVGVMNNLPYCIDEMTNLKAEAFSDLIYNMSQGRGKDRVKASSNELRANLTSWQTISLCSSNSSFYEKLAAYKNSPDGEMMRLFEYKIDKSGAIDTALAKHSFDHVLLENYGHAGPIYAQWLVSNLTEAREGALSIQRKIDRELKLTQRERFWSAMVAANITGGRIAHLLGLIDGWDMRAIYQWATRQIQDLRKETLPPATDVASIIGDYINRHMTNILVVEDGMDRRTLKSKAPQMEPRGELLIRYEPDTKRMYLASKAFKDDCVDSQVNFKETLTQLTQSGVLVIQSNGSSTVNKRLSKGTKVASPPVSCLMLDCTRDEFIDVEQLVGPEDDTGGD